MKNLFLNCRSSNSDYRRGSHSESETKSESDTEIDSDSDVGKKSVKSKTHSHAVEKHQLSSKWYLITDLMFSLPPVIKHFVELIEMMMLGLKMLFC